GLLLLANGNTFTGLVTVDTGGGVLRIQHSNALGSTAVGTVVKSGGALELDGDPTSSGGSITISNETLTLNGTGVANTGALRNLTGNNTWAGSVTLQTDSSIGVDGGTQLTVNGTVQDPTPAVNPAPGLTKVGAGTLVFPNANTYTGTTTISNGRLNVRSATALGGSGSAGTVVNSGG